ncbi:MAG: F0F1 ATP synthase subunit epsilon [Neisseriaceae bacterium]|jgi:F-type H+-transporting ATPase subunit epsilon
MAGLMHVDIVDAESRVFAGEAEFLIINAFDGEIGIFPNHIPLISKLKPGVLRIKAPNQDNQKVFALSGGFIEVCDNNVLVMADIVERTDELDEQKLIEQKNLALNRLKHADTSSSTYEVAKAQAALEIAIAQLRALEYIKKRGKNF